MDSNGAMFTEYIITPIIDHLKEYLNQFLEPKTFKNAIESNDGSDESIDSDYSRDNSMSYSGNIIGTMRMIKSKKFRRDLLMYIGARVHLQKIVPTKKSKKPQKVIKPKK